MLTSRLNSRIFYICYVVIMDVSAIWIRALIYCKGFQFHRIIATAKFNIETFIDLFLSYIVLKGRETFSQSAYLVTS